MRRLDAVEALPVGAGMLEAGALFDIGTMSARGSLEYQHRIRRNLAAVAGGAIDIDRQLDPRGTVYGAVRWRF